MSTPQNITELVKELQGLRTDVLFSSEIGLLSDKERKIVCKVVNAFPSIAAAFLANEEKLAKLQEERDTWKKMHCELSEVHSADRKCFEIVRKREKKAEEKLRIAAEALEKCRPTVPMGHGAYNIICKALARIRPTPLP